MTPSESPTHPDAPRAGGETPAIDRQAPSEGRLADIEQTIKAYESDQTTIGLSPNEMKVLGLLRELRTVLLVLRSALLERHRDGERAAMKWEIERIGADWLAGACCRMVDEGFIDARSEIGDALLDYASMRHGDREPIANVRTEYVRLKERRYAPPSPERAPND